MRLIFADTRAGMAHAASLRHAPGAVRIVALSAEALDAAQAAGVDCEAIGRITRGGRESIERQEDVFCDWFAALGELEQALAAEIAECQFDGPGMLLSRAYPIAFAINSVRARAALMIAAVLALAPTVVTVIEAYRDARYAGDGYTSNPWTLAFEAWANSRGLPVEVIDVYMAQAPTLRERLLAWARGQSWIARLRRGLRRTNTAAGAGPRLAGLEKLRVFFSDSIGYDWAPVAHLLARGRAKLFTLPRAAQPVRDEFASYEAGAPLPQAVDHEIHARIGAVFDNWAVSSSWPARLTTGGVDVFGALRPYLRRLAMTGPEVLRRADAIAESVLDTLRPDVACFLVIAYPYQKRLAFACRRRGIPVICYQHGGAYGTHDVAVHDFIEGSDADVFLVYGEKIRPRPAPVMPVRARYAAVGSARIEEVALPGSSPWRRATGGLHVVFAGDVTYRNTLTAGTEIEDTARFELETLALATLARATGIHVTYRPFPAHLDAQGTPAWLARQAFANVSSDARTPMATLLRDADLVITLSSSGTLWNESIAQGVPLVAYADPAYTVLSAEFRASLSRAALLCESRAQFAAALDDIAARGAVALGGFAEKPRAEFLRDYVLANGECARAAVGILARARG
jgi:hypothetical protein